MTQNVSENRIIADVLGGNTRAFASIMERYAPKVFAMAAGMVGNQDDAADLTQEIFLKVFTSLSSFKGNSSFSTWLFRISYNMALSRLRRGGRPDSTTGDDGFWNAVADTEPEADEEEEGEITTEMLCEALERLSADERTLVTFFYLEEKSLAEIAFIMSISETNAKTRLFRIRKKLRKIISDGIR